MTTTFRWRPLATGDLPAVEAIAAAVHPAFPEGREVFAERQRLHPEGAAILEMDGKAAGYAISHPWRFSRLPALNTMLGGIPTDADTYLLHDLALLPRTRGVGAAGAFVDATMRRARDAGFATLSLVAVNGSMSFWRKQGFEVVEMPELAEKLVSYDEAARLMVHRL